MMRCVCLAQGVVKRLSASVWKLHGLSMEGKMGSFKTMVLPVLLHGCETWNLNELALSKMEGFTGRTLRTILGLGWEDKVSFEEMRHRTGMCCQGPAAWHLRYRQLRWFGHMIRMDPDRWPVQIMCGRPPDSRRPQRRPRHRWEDKTYEHLTELGMSTRDHVELREIISDRARWREIIKTPMSCQKCIVEARARAEVQEGITNIEDQIARSEDPIDRPKSLARRRERPAAEKNPEATWTDRDQPWFFPTTNAGPVYGRSRSGRRLTRPNGRESNTGPGGNCPYCHERWDIMLPRRFDNVPVKPGNVVCMASKCLSLTDIPGEVVEVRDEAISIIIVINIINIIIINAVPQRSLPSTTSASSLS